MCLEFGKTADRRGVVYQPHALAIALAGRHLTSLAQLKLIQLASLSDVLDSASLIP
jgi:hypothetical protein